MIRHALVTAAVAVTVAATATPAQAVTNPGRVYVEVNAARSQSNVLVSFQQSNSIYQKIIAEGARHGEGQTADYYAEPQNAWANPGWCLWYRRVVTNTNEYDATKTYAWFGTYGGSAGRSVSINPGGGLPSGWIHRSEVALTQGPCA